GSDIRDHEQLHHKDNNTTSGICRSSRAKPKLSLCIVRCPILWLFRPYRGCPFTKAVLHTFGRKSIRKTRRLKSLPLRIVGMFFFCYRQIFARRPFRSGKVCAFKLSLAEILTS